MYNFKIVLLSLIFLIHQSQALIPRSEAQIFSKEYERQTVDDVQNSILDVKHNIENLNFYGTFNAQTDEDNNKNNKNEIRKVLDDNKDIRRILNEIEQEEANDTKLTDEVEEITRGFLSDLEYYKNKINESVNYYISDHVVLNDLAEGEIDINFDSNTLIEEPEEDAEKINELVDEPGGGSEDVKEYNPAPDESPTSGRRIYRGTNTRIRQFPFMASIHVMGKFYCAGSIIGSSLVITAASCLQLAWNNRFFRENPKFLYVRVGSTFYNGAGEFIQVLECLRAKECGDWRCLCVAEKKALYRASFCQTFAEFQYPTGTWKLVLGGVLFLLSFVWWIALFNKMYVYGPRPSTFDESARQAQLRKMLEIRVNPIDGLSSKWDYDLDTWKKKDSWF